MGFIITTLFGENVQPSVRRGAMLFASLVALNIVVWIVALLFVARFPLFLGLVALAWGLGLRHAMDADHIAAIDNVTRRLLYRGKPSVGVGFFFSLGHSTIVLCFTAVIVFAASYAIADIAAFREAGALIGGTVSSVFLLAIGTANLFVLRQLFRAWRDIRAGKENTYHGHLHLGGPIEKIFRPLIALVDRSPKMYWIGLLFGLGFDTATEVGLLALSALALETIDAWMIFLLPVSFMAGMTLVDTLNSLMMLGIYSWEGLSAEHRVRYNLNVTALSAASALLLGGVIGLRLLAEHAGLSGSIFALAQHVRIDMLGYALVFLFILSWVQAFLPLRPREEKGPS